MKTIEAEAVFIPSVAGIDSQFIFIRPSSITERVCLLEVFLDSKGHDIRSRGRPLGRLECVKCGMLIDVEANEFTVYGSRLDVCD